MYRSIALLAAGLLVLTAASSHAQDAALEWYGRGVHAYFSGDYVKAYEDLTQAVEEDTKDPRVYYFRGLTYIQLGRPEQAEEDFKNGAQREAGDFNKFYNVSRSLERIQGSVRLTLERHRVVARIIAMEKAEELRKQRYGERREEERMILEEQINVRRGLPSEVPPAPAAQDPFAAEPAAGDPFAEPGAEPAAEPGLGPAAEPGVGPAAEPGVGPAADPFAEPAVEPAVEPAAEPAVEPGAGPAAAPGADDPFAQPPVGPAAGPAAGPPAGKKPGGIFGAIGRALGRGYAGRGGQPPSGMPAPLPFGGQPPGPPPGLAPGGQPPGPPPGPAPGAQPPGSGADDPFAEPAAEPAAEPPGPAATDDPFAEPAAEPAAEPPAAEPPAAQPPGGQPPAAAADDPFAEEPGAAPAPPPAVPPAKKAPAKQPGFDPNDPFGP